MVALQAVSAWVPEQRVSVEDLREHLGLSPAKAKLMTRIHGLREVRYDPGATVADGLLRAAAPLVAAVPDRSRIRYLLYARTLLDIAPSTVNVAYLVRDELGLEHATTFSLTQQNCATGLLAIDVAAQLLESDSDDTALALVLTGEKPFSPLSQLIPNTTIMGEAAAACLVGQCGDRDRVVSFASRTLGRYSAGLDLDEEAARHFDQDYLATLLEVISEAVRAAGLSLDDIALLLPHNVNRSSWLRAFRRLELPLERVFLANVATLGHCYCADPFINYVSARDQGLLSRGDHYMMAAVGLGATFTALVLQH